MKYLKFVIFYTVAVFLLVITMPVNAVDVVIAVTSTPVPVLSPTTSATPPVSTTPQATVSPTPQTSPKATISPSVSPTAQPAVSVTVSVTPAVSPPLTITPTSTASPSTTPIPSENVGGANIIIPSPTAVPISPTSTPTQTPTPTPTRMPFSIQKTEPPVKTAAEKIYKNIVVSPLSFLLQRPAEDFYKNNQMTPSMTYGLSAIALLGMISGIAFLFPAQLTAIYKKMKLSTGSVISQYPNSSESWAN